MATLKKTASKLKHEGRDQKHAEPHGQPQPNPNQNPAPTATAAAAAVPPAPAAVALRPSGSRDSGSSSSSSGSWSTSMPEEYGEGTSDSTSTSTSTATLRTGGRGKRRHSDTTYPGRRKGSSSTDTGTETESQDKMGTKFWIYTVVATTLVIATASAIGMSLRATEAATQEPPEYTLPKGVTVTTPAATPPQCNCANGNATANPGLGRGLASSEPGRRRRRTKTESPDKLAASGGNASDVERLSDEDAEDAVPDDGVPQKKVAGKATRSLVAFKIGPGRRKNAGEPATSPKPAIRNRTSARKTSKPRARRREQTRSTKTRATVKNAAGKKKSTATATSRTLPARSSKTVESFVKPEVNEAADRERERPPVNAERRSSNAAAKPGDGADTEEVGALNAAAHNAAGTATFTKRWRRGAG